MLPAFPLLALKATLVAAEPQLLAPDQPLVASEPQTLVLIERDDELQAAILLEKEASMTWQGESPTALSGNAYVLLTKDADFSINGQTVRLSRGETCLQESQPQACDTASSAQALEALQTPLFSLLPPLDLDSPPKAPTDAELTEVSNSSEGAGEQSACLDGAEGGEASSIDQQEGTDLSSGDVKLRIEVQFP